MVCYNNSIIYKLCCNDVNITEIYVGSTTNFLRRKQEHRNACNLENGPKYNRKVYKFIRNNGNFENWSMIQIEQYNATDKRDLEKKERYHIDDLKSTLNCQLPGQTNKECHRIYDIKNKDKIKEYKQQYYIINKEKNKQYYEDNKDKIQKRNKEKIKCECGCIVSKQCLNIHEKTIKHLKFINSL